MKVLIITLWVLAAVGVIMGSCILVGGTLCASTVPQEVAVCALAFSCAVLPYALAWAMMSISNQEN